jgi:hypothetical protein
MGSNPLTYFGLQVFLFPNTLRCQVQVSETLQVHTKKVRDWAYNRADVIVSV